MPGGSNHPALPPRRRPHRLKPSGGGRNPFYPPAPAKLPRPAGFHDEPHLKASPSAPGRNGRSALTMPRIRSLNRTGECVPIQPVPCGSWRSSQPQRTARLPATNQLERVQFRRRRPLGIPLARLLGRGVSQVGDAPARARGLRRRFHARPLEVSPCVIEVVRQRPLTTTVATPRLFLLPQVPGGGDRRRLVRPDDRGPS